MCSVWHPFHDCSHFISVSQSFSSFFQPSTCHSTKLTLKDRKSMCISTEISIGEDLYAHSIVSPWFCFTLQLPASPPKLLQLLLLLIPPTRPVLLFLVCSTTPNQPASNTASAFLPIPCYNLFHCQHRLHLFFSPPAHLQFFFSWVEEQTN